MDTSGCSAPAVLAIAASRLSYAIAQGTMDARESLKQKLDENMPKFDDGSSNSYPDPNDPTKVRLKALSIAFF